MVRFDGVRSCGLRRWRLSKIALASGEDSKQCRGCQTVQDIDPAKMPYLYRDSTVGLWSISHADHPYRASLAHRASTVGMKSLVVAGLQQWQQSRPNAIASGGFSQ
jgi:hypothetical protein